MRRQSKPVHAGVDMQRGGMTHAGPVAKIGPFGHFGQRTEHRNELRLRIDFGGGGRESIEDEDARLRGDGAQGLAFRQVGDKKRAASRGEQCPCDRGEPQAIGVGLDDAGAFSAFRALGQHAPIIGQRAEIYGENRLAHRPVFVGSGDVQHGKILIYGLADGLPAPDR